MNRGLLLGCLRRLRWKSSNTMFPKLPIIKEPHPQSLRVYTSSITPFNVSSMNLSRTTSLSHGSREEQREITVLAPLSVSERGWGRGQKRSCQTHVPLISPMYWGERGNLVPSPIQLTWKLGE
jgi:hypothetical protein